MWEGCWHLLGLHQMRGQVPDEASVGILLIAVLYYWAGLDTEKMILLKIPDN